MVDVATARRAGFHVGDDVAVAVATGTQHFTLVGLVRFGTEDGVPRTTVTLFDPDTAASALGQPGFDTVAIAAEDRSDLTGLEARVQAAVDARYGPGQLEAILGGAASQEQADAVKDYFSFVTRALAAFSAAALFVGGFLILNTFTITLTQRTRELALLRAIGASRRQVFASQVAEAGIIGLVSGAIGAVAGIALAEGLRWLFRVAGAALPPGPLVVSPAGLVRITLLGAAVTVVAALYPCWRATTGRAGRRHHRRRRALDPPPRRPRRARRHRHRGRRRRPSPSPSSATAATGWRCSGSAPSSASSAWPP